MEFVGGNNYVNLAGRDKDIQEKISIRNYFLTLLDMLEG